MTASVVVEMVAERMCPMVWMVMVVMVGHVILSYIGLTNLDWWGNYYDYTPYCAYHTRQSGLSTQEMYHSQYYDNICSSIIQLNYSQFHANLTRQRKVDLHHAKDCQFSLYFAPLINPTTCSATNCPNLYFSFYWHLAIRKPFKDNIKNKIGSTQFQARLKPSCWETAERNSSVSVDICFIFVPIHPPPLTYNPIQNPLPGLAGNPPVILIKIYLCPLWFWKITPPPT